MSTPAIITSFPKYSDGELHKALEREIRTGLQLKKEMERARIERSAIEAKEQKGVEVPGLGRCVANVPQWDFFRLVQKYGWQEVHSKEFVKYFQKKMPELAPNKL